MKREIKFRAWDKKFSRMYEYGEKCIGIHYDDWELQRLFENGDEAECVEIDGEEIILMQFTGLKDKNDKEIYESDVANILGRYNCVCIWNEEDASFVWWEYKYGKQINAGQILMDDTQNDEIIGNIYENPDLISTL